MHMIVHVAAYIVLNITGTFQIQLVGRLWVMV